jgi:hypothetical protein
MSIVTNRANVVLSGPESRFASINSLSLNDVDGEFHLLDGRDFGTAGAFSNRGLLELERATFSVDGSLTLDESSVLEIQLEGGAGFGRVDAIGDLLLGGVLDLEVSGAIAPEDVFTILSSQGVISGRFANVASGERIDVGIGTFLFSISSDEVRLSGFEAPEPSALLLLGAGLLEIARRRRRSARPLV